MISFDDLIDSSSDDEIEEDESMYSKVFLKHLRKCFIATDKSTYCEQSILPDLKISNKKKNEILLLNERINENAYDYIKINKSDGVRSSIASRPSKLFRLNSLAFDLNNSIEIKKQTIDVDENPLASYELEIDSNMTDNKIFHWSNLLRANEQSAFQFYAKYEAINQDASEAKTFKIFLPIKGPDNLMCVTILKTALISDLIGLTCYKFECENRIPKLSFKSVENYELKISDEFGNIEEDLMIESNQRVAKYGFQFLSLIENSDLVKSKKNKVQVQILFMDNSIQEYFEYDSDNILMKDVFERIYAFKMTQIGLFCPKLDFKLEHVDKIGKEIDLENSYLFDFRKFEFVFYRKNSVWSFSPLGSILDSASVEQKSDLTRTISESSRFELLFLSKWRKEIFNIDLSKDELVMEEISNKKTNFYTIPIKYLVDCYVSKDPKKSESQIRIIIAEEENINSILYKHLDFEGNARLIDELKTNIDHVIHFCNSPFYLKYQTISKKNTIKWSRRAYRDKNSKNK